MFQHIVVPLDGSKVAEQALAFAERLAIAARGKIWLVRAADTWALTPKRRAEKDLVIRREARAELSSLSLAMNFRGISSDWEVTSGEAAAIIVGAAKVRAADLIVMSTRGRGSVGQRGYGSVAERVLRAARCPILLVPAQCDVAWPATGRCDGPIVVPLDGSTRAEEALEPAKELALVLGASLLLVRAVEPSAVGSPRATGARTAAGELEEEAKAARHYLGAIARDLEAQEYEVDWHAPTGYAETIIGHLATERRAAAIAMATHGRSGIARVVLGSIASGVIQRSTVPVLVTRPVSLAEAMASEQKATPAGVQT